MTDRQTHRPTDPQTQGEKQYVSQPLQGGDIITITENFLRISFLQDFFFNLRAWPLVGFSFSSKKTNQGHFIPGSFRPIFRVDRLALVGGSFRQKSIQTNMVGTDRPLVW